MRPRKTQLRTKLRGLARAYRNLPWMIGDAINEGDRTNGEDVYTLAGELRLSEAQLYDFARVARVWPRSKRVFDLPWSYYRDAGTDLGVAGAVLSSTCKMGWSRDQMRQCLQRIRKLSDEHQ